MSHCEICEWVDSFIGEFPEFHHVRSTPTVCAWMNEKNGLFAECCDGVCACTKRKIIDFHFHFHMKRVTSKSLWLLTLIVLLKNQKSLLLHLRWPVLSRFSTSRCDASNNRWIVGEAIQSELPRCRSAAPSKFHKKKARRSATVSMIKSLAPLITPHYHFLINLCLYALPFAIFVIVAVQGRFAIER